MHFPQTSQVGFGAQVFLAVEIAWALRLKQDAPNPDSPKRLQTLFEPLSILALPSDHLRVAFGVPLVV